MITIISILFASIFFCRNWIQKLPHFRTICIHQNQTNYMYYFYKLKLLYNFSLFLKKSNLLYCGILLALFCTGCNGEKKGHVKNEATKIKISFSAVKEMVMTDSIINNITPIKLEDNEDEVGTVTKLIVEDNKFIIWDDAKKTIWIFSTGGKFLGRISHFGNGDGKYASIYNISYSAPNVVNVIDGVSRSIKSYSINGNFVSEEKTKGNVSDYLSFSNRKFLFYYFRFKKWNTYQFSVQEPDNSKIGFFEYQKPFLFVGHGGDYLLRNKDVVYLRRPYNDTIFSYQNKELKAKYIFDFGKNAYPTKEIYAVETLKQVSDILSKKEYEGNVSNFFISNSYILLTFNKQKSADITSSSVLLRNLATGTTMTYRYLGGIKGEVTPNYPMATDGESFYSYHNSSEFPDTNKIAKRTGPSLRSNPIIIKYNYKL